MKKNTILNLAYARLLMKVADLVVAFAIPLIVYESTRSVVWSGVAFFIERLPRILFLPFGGWLTDHFGSRKLMILSDILRVILMVSAFFTCVGSPSRAAIVLPFVGAFISLLNAQSFVALETYLSHILKESKDNQATYLQIADQASVLLAPLIATGAQMLSSTLHLTLVAALLYFSSIVFIKNSGIESPKGKIPLPSPFNEIKSGIKYVYSDSRLIALAGLAFCLNLIGGLGMASSAALVVGKLGLDKNSYSLLQVTCGILALGMMFIMTRMKSKANFKPLGLMSYIAIVSGAIVTSIAESLPVLIVGYALLNAPVGLFNIYIRAQRAELIGIEKRGTVTGVMLLLGQMALPFSGLMLSIVGRVHVNIPFLGAAVFSLIILLLSSRLLQLFGSRI